jgi:hypothetical protein
VAIVLGTPNSLINTRLNTPNTITDIIPNPIWKNPNRIIVANVTLGIG